MGEEQGAGRILETFQINWKKINTNRPPIADDIIHAFSGIMVNPDTHGPTPRARVMAEESVSTRGRRELPMTLFGAAPKVHL
eukprot:4682717-Pyramimonas_sp.AAC.1